MDGAVTGDGGGGGEWRGHCLPEWNVARMPFKRMDTGESLG